MKNVVFTIDIEVATPLLIKAVGATAFGVNQPFYRNYSGLPAIQGSEVRGLIRHACQNFEKKFIEEWLGTASQKDNNPQPGRLIFSSYWIASGQHKNNSLIVHNTINDETGAVAHGALMFVEDPFPNKRTVVFSGKIYTLADEKDIKKLERVILLALHHVPAIGSKKGVGYGKIKTIRMASTEKSFTIDRNNTDSQWKDNRCYFALRFTDPFCFSKHQLGNNEAYINAPEHDPSLFRSGLNNAFISEDFISGGAIKGAIAQTASRLKTNTDDYTNSALDVLLQHLDKITIGHARYQRGPENSNFSLVKRPNQIPLSLAYFDSLNEHGGHFPFIDLADHCTDNRQSLYMKYSPSRHSETSDNTDQTPASISSKYEAPQFSVDWKFAVKRKASALYLWSDEAPDRTLFLHTAIDPDTNAALESQLFTYEAIIPENYCWVSYIQLPETLGDKNGSTQSPANELLSTLKHALTRIIEFGLPYLGKTKAVATAHWLPYQNHPSNTLVLQKGDRVAITLQSLALIPLVDPNNHPIDNNSDLWQAYNQFWRKESKKAFSLVTFFAKQRLVGGSHLWRRYWNESAYNPKLATEDSSVFVLKVENASDAETVLNGWVRFGLTSADSQDWSKNPFVNTNGYGEIHARKIVSPPQMPSNFKLLNIMDDINSGDH